MPRDLLEAPRGFAVGPRSRMVKYSRSFVFEHEANTSRTGIRQGLQVIPEHGRGRTVS